MNYKADTSTGQLRIEPKADSSTNQLQFELGGRKWHRAVPWATVAQANKQIKLQGRQYHWSVTDSVAHLYQHSET